MRHNFPVAKFLKISVLISLLFTGSIFAQNEITFETAAVSLTNVPRKIKIKPTRAFLIAHLNQKLPASVRLAASGALLQETELQIDSTGNFQPAELSVTLKKSGRAKLQIQVGGLKETIPVRTLPGILSILPPLLAILLALITRQVIIALFCGIWLGVSFIYDYNIFTGFLRTLDHYLVNAVADPDRISIIIFTLVLGGMVGVISKAGGTQGIVEKLTHFARDSRRGQLVTWAMGVLIFFDDYANTLIVGNTMRPLSDKLRISREKLAYLVDSTAAPVANIAIISTWIGYEISLIDQSLKSMDMTGNAYLIFIRTIPYNFYPIYTLLTGLFIALLLRDFGPMFRAEKRAAETGEVLAADATPLADLASSELAVEEGTPLRWYNALIPILVVIGVVGLGLVFSGWSSLQATGTTLTDLSLVRKASLIVGSADSFAVLMWAAFLGSIAAIFLALSQKLLTLHQALEAWVHGIRSMMMAAIILTAAWAIGNICQDLYTADYVVSITRKFLTPHWLPVISFLTAAVISFATGTSWGTMAILMPIAIPLAHKFPLTDPTISAAHAMGLLLSTTAAVLAGATFGDHCSPISDTTIMSSMASGSDHIDHVRTQLPYAVLAGGVACLFGYIPIGLGISTWVVLPLGFISIILFIRFFGKRASTH